MVCFLNGLKLVKVSELRRFARKLDADEETRPASRFNACTKASGSDFRAPAEAHVVVRGIGRG